MGLVEDILVWIAALLTLMVYSYLYKDTILYKFAEYTLIGSGAGILFVTNVFPIFYWTKEAASVNFPLIMPLILGVLLYARFFKGKEWLSGYSVAFMTGVGTALTIRGMIDAQFYGQIVASWLPLTKPDLFADFSNATLLIALMTSMLYFVFSLGYQGRLAKPVSTLGRVGRYFLMLAFGASAGVMTMGRTGLLIGRLWFLLHEWLKLV